MAIERYSFLCCGSDFRSLFYLGIPLGIPFRDTPLKNLGIPLGILFAIFKGLFEIGNCPKNGVKPPILAFSRGETTPIISAVILELNICIYDRYARTDAKMAIKACAWRLMRGMR